MLSLGKPFVLRHSNWGARKDISAEARDVRTEGSSAVVASHFSCVAERTRKSNRPPSARTARKNELERMLSGVGLPGCNGKQHKHEVGGGKRRRVDQGETASAARHSSGRVGRPDSKNNRCVSTMRR